MNKKGQALIEFVLILPIIILIILSFVDFGKILFDKIALENTLNSVVKMIENNEPKEEIENFINNNTKNKVTLNIKYSKNIEVNLSKEISVITPGLNLILDNPYKINVKRLIYEV